MQKLVLRIEVITSQIETLTSEIAKAKDKAAASRDNNLVQLTGEIEKQKASIREQIEELDSEVLTKPEVMAQ